MKDNSGLDELRKHNNLPDIDGLSNEQLARLESELTKMSGRFGATKTQRINTYTCPSGHVLVVRDIDEGTTPMFMRCMHCTFQGKSAFYNVPPGLTPTHEWYKPKHPENYAFGPMREHIEAGGLAFRQIGEPDETEAMKPPKSPFKSGRNSALVMRALTNNKK